jgi:hypothetical protein
LPSGSTEYDIEIVRDHVSIEHVDALAIASFGDFVKAVVDVEAGIMAINAELHADEEAMLLDAGSRQANLWGINLYPAAFGTSGWIEFDSMINVRPSQGNRTRAVDDPSIRDRIGAIVGRLVR